MKSERKKTRHEKGGNVRTPPNGKKKALSFRRQHKPRRNGVRYL